MAGAGSNLAALEAVAVASVAAVTMAVVLAGVAAVASADLAREEADSAVELVAETVAK